MEPYFTTGDPSVIEKGRKEYRKIYQTNWKRNKRQVAKEYTISLTPLERRRIQKEAKHHVLTIPQYIKQTALSYRQTAYIVPDVELLSQLRLTLSLLYTKITASADNDHEISELVRHLEEIESRLTKYICNPDTVLTALHMAIGDDPCFAEKIHSLLNDLAK